MSGKLDPQLNGQVRAQLVAAGFIQLRFAEVDDLPRRPVPVGLVLQGLLAAARDAEAPRD